ncbi:MAG: cobalamin biosynthesis protein [Clostridia bacterium]|nr:cobalamin biosynthesis protein [Clostridia bacterium]MBQ4085483.1 cobalamin biosynthesis protein [Clostridia bacterium]
MFFSFQSAWLELILAFVLHMLIGAPQWLWKIHPARLIIWLEKFLEGVLREKMGFELRRAGGVLSIACIAVSFAAGFLLSGFSWIARVLVMNFAFNCARMFILPAKAEKALQVHDLSKARQIISRYVRTDTERISERESISATVLFMGHSLCDACIAPLFWISLFSLIGLGSPAAMVWISIDALDRRIGNRTRNNTDIGWFSAKLSDIAGAIPARLSGWAVVIATAILRMDFRRALRIMDRDHGAHISPNGGWAAAALSGALGIQLGGDVRIKGVVIHRRLIGDPATVMETDDIGRALRIMTVAVGGALLLAVIALAVFGA